MKKLILRFRFGWTCILAYMLAFFPLTAVTTLVTQSCTFKMLPAYSVEIYNQTSDASEATDQLYYSIISSENTNYADWADQYTPIRAKINNLIIKQESRPHSKDLLVKQMKNVQTLFEKYRLFHERQGTLSKAQAEVFRKYMADAWKPVLNSENYLK